MQSRTTMRCCFTPVGMGIKKMDNAWGSRGEMRPFLCCRSECETAQPLWKTVWRFLKSLYMELPSDPTIPVPDTYPRKLCPRLKLYVVLTAALLVTAKKRKPRCAPTDKWTHKMWYTSMIDHYPALEGNDILTPATTQMSPETSCWVKGGDTKGHTL